MRESALLMWLMLFLLFLYLNFTTPHDKGVDGVLVLELLLKG